MQGGRLRLGFLSGDLGAGFFPLTVLDRESLTVLYSSLP